MDPHPYGWLSVVPPLLAIVLAIVTQRVVLSLLLGVLAGALITTGGHPVAAVAQMLELHLWKTLVDESKLRIFAFTLVMGAMVGVVNRSAGMRGLVEAIAPLAKTRRRGQLVAWLLGLVIFFDDYTNTVLLGNTLRPLCDRLRISREKLAYLVDSTAAPVAGLALVSTWVAVEISFVQDGLDRIGTEHGLQAFSLFVASIPYRFYVIWTLVFVALVAAMNRDFGAMLTAERRAQKHDEAGAGLSADAASAPPALEPEHHLPARWYNAVVPIAVTVVAIVWLLWTTGMQALADVPRQAEPTLMEIFGRADAYQALVWGSVAGLATAIVLVRVQGLLTGPQVTASAAAGASLMLPALAILWLASTLSNMTGESPVAGVAPADAAQATAADNASSRKDPYPNRGYRLYTARYLRSLLGERLPPPWLPTIVFLLAAATSFATGTSWGTMGVLMPLVVPLAYTAAGGSADVGARAGGSEAAIATSPILLATIGSVLAGAIFGDHCSPISDTTVLSSQSSACDHIAHVRTQLPYALSVAAAAVVLGTLPAGYGVSPWLLSIAGCAALALLVWLAGQRVEGS